MEVNDLDPDFEVKDHNQTLFLIFDFDSIFVKTDHDKVHKSNEFDPVMGSLNLTHFRGH